MVSSSISSQRLRKASCSPQSELMLLAKLLSAILLGKMMSAKLVGRWKALFADSFSTQPRALRKRFQRTAQVESVDVDPELVDHLHHAKRLVSSSSAKKIKLRTGLVGTRLLPSLSAGLRRAPTLASTLTRPSSPLRCCEEGVRPKPVSLFSNSACLQELPNEVQENFLSRAILLMHTHPMVSTEVSLFLAAPLVLQWHMFIREKKRRREAPVAFLEVQDISSKSFLIS